MTWTRRSEHGGWRLRLTLRLTLRRQAKAKKKKDAEFKKKNRKNRGKSAGQFDEKQAKVYEKDRDDKKHNDLSRDFGEKSGQWGQRQWQWRCCRRTPRSSQFEPKFVPSPLQPGRPLTWCSHHTRQLQVY